MQSIRFTPWTALALFKSAYGRKTRFGTEKSLAGAFARACRSYYTTGHGSTSAARGSRSRWTPHTSGSSKRMSATTPSLYASTTWQTVVGHFGYGTRCSYHFGCVPSGSSTKMNATLAQCVGQCMSSKYSGYQPYGMVWINGTNPSRSTRWQAYVDQLWSEEGIFLCLCFGGKTWVHPTLGTSKTWTGWKKTAAAA